MANGYTGGAGIGGGDNQIGTKTYIYSGTVLASSRIYGGAGIGGGKDEGTRGIWIYGGDITGNGSDGGAGIGAGKDSGTLGAGIRIYGGTVRATGGINGGAGNGDTEFFGTEGDMKGTITIDCGNKSDIVAYGGYRAC